ncbi:hypothetical protein HQ571_00710 [Candidatus Kuenenbacteria bacterium]|nr:hypothetical protein [Candidatus Kuenenbacteria bacterium]
MKYLWLIVACCLFVSCRVEVESKPSKLPAPVAVQGLSRLLEAGDYEACKTYVEDQKLDRQVVLGQCRLLLIKMVKDEMPKEKIVGLIDHCEMTIEALQSIVREYLDRNDTKRKLPEISQIGQPKVDGELITQNDIKNFFAREIHAGKNPERALELAVEYDLSDHDKTLAAEMICLQVMALDCRRDNSCAAVREKVIGLVNKYKLDLEKLVKIMVDCGHAVDPLLVFPIRVVN